MRERDEVTPTPDEVRQARRMLDEYGGGGDAVSYGRDAMAAATVRANLRMAEAHPEAAAFHIRRAAAFQQVIDEEEQR